MNNVRCTLNNIKENVVVKKVIRLGKKTAIPQPLKVVLNSSTDVKHIFKNRNKVPDYRIKSDDSPMQKEYLKKSTQ